MERPDKIEVRDYELGNALQTNEENGCFVAWATGCNAALATLLEEVVRISVPKNPLQVVRDARPSGGCEQVAGSPRKATQCTRRYARACNDATQGSNPDTYKDY